ncbi:hypothetical protein FKP32DRAFT_291957 [Trametes sanguinea]|nr:hypothetical protein FKP32DRAFT_291957 [Trametes sanguinea]
MNRRSSGTSAPLSRPLTCDLPHPRIEFARVFEPVHWRPHTSAEMDGVDILGLITGIFSILSVPIGVVAIIYNLLSCTRLRELEQIFAETEDMLHKTAEAGLLGPQRTASGFQTRLEALRISLEDVRVESHCAATYAQNFKKMLAGLSRRSFLSLRPSQDAPRRYLYHKCS